MRLQLVIFLSMITAVPSLAQEVLPKPKEPTVPGAPASIPKPVIVTDPAASQVLNPPRILVVPQTSAPQITISPLPYPRGYYRRSSMEHWQHLSADSQGFMRPRVLLTPDGPVYSYDGRPFLFLNQEPRIVGPAGTLP